MSSETDKTTEKSTHSTNVTVNESFNDISSVIRNPWDPLHCSDWDSQQPSATCVSRMKRDISSMFKDPPPGIFIAPDSNNITMIHALVIGPFDTPYEGGFFYFLIRFPPDYPIRAPRCRLMTTGNNTVRFNPNLYRNGKVCLSILGTWSGPSWSPAQCISSVIISIQSLMSENPYHNEPGFEQERTPGDSKTYNEIIKHETLRVAVCDMLENPNSCPKELHEIMVKQFFDFYDYYIETCKENIDKDGQKMMDPFSEPRGVFQYSSILTRLCQLKNKLANCDTSKSQITPTDQGILKCTATTDSRLLPTNDMDLDDIFNDNNDDDTNDEADDKQNDNESDHIE